MITSDYTLYAWKDNGDTFAPVLAIKGEAMRRRLIFKLIGDDSPIDLTEVRAFFYLKKRDRNEIFLNMQTEDEINGIVSVLLTPQACALGGITAHTEIRLTYPDMSCMKIIGPRLRIADSSSEQALESTCEFQALDKLIIKSGQAVADAQKAAVSCQETTRKSEIVTKDATKAAQNAENKALLASTIAENAAQVTQNTEALCQSLHEDTVVQGSCVTATALALPPRSLRIYGKTTEFTATGVKSPDNPSVITGTGQDSGLTLSVHGENYFNFQAEHTTGSSIFELQNGIKIVTQAGSGKIYAIPYKNPILLIPGKVYQCHMRITVAGSDGKPRGCVRIGRKDGALVMYSPVPAAKDGIYAIQFEFTAPPDGAVTVQLNYQGNIDYPLPAGITIIWENIMISTPELPYIPYNGQEYAIPLSTPLYSLPNGTRDTLEKKDGRWGVTRRVGSATIDGAAYKAGWVGNEVNGVYQFNVGLPNKIFVNGKNACSDKFIFAGITSKDGEAFVGSTADLCLQISKTRTGGVVSSAAANAWLQNNPVFALYSRTETFEVFPQGTQDILNSITAVNGKNIVLSNSNAEMEFVFSSALNYLLDQINFLKTPQYEASLNK